MSKPHPFDDLRLRTGKVAERLEKPGLGVPRGEAFTLRAGQIFVLRETASADVEWVVTHVDRSASRCFVVAADTKPLAGKTDVAIAAGAPCGPLTLRCASGSWIPGSCLDPALSSYDVPTEGLVAARTIIARRADADETLAEPQGVDTAPEYREWIEEIVEPALARLRDTLGLPDTASQQADPPQGQAPSTPGRGGGGPWRRGWYSRPFLLAASVLFGLAATFLSWQWQSGDSRTPPLQQEASSRSQIAFATLRPGRAVRSTAECLPVTGDASSIFLHLERELDGPEATDPYYLELEDRQTGETVARLDIPGAQPLIKLVAASVGKPAYRLQLFGRDRGPPLLWCDIDLAPAAGDHRLPVLTIEPTFAILEPTADGTAPEQSLHLPAAGERIYLLLIGGYSEAHTAYRARIEDRESGRRLWNQPPIAWHRIVAGIFLELPREALGGASAVHLDLYGTQDASEHLIEQYAFDLEGTPKVSTPTRP